MKEILVLSDGRPGHYNQSLAVAEVLQEIEPSRVTVMDIQVKKYTKYLLRLLLNSQWGKAILRKTMTPQRVAWFYEGYDDTSKPDVVVSSGKDTSLLNALLGLMYDTKTLFVGNPKKLDNRLFTAVLTVLDLGFDNQIVLDVAPTLPYKGDLTAFCKENELDPDATYYTLLIGGDGSGYRYTEAEYDAMIDLVNTTPDDIKWLVTTSRRTPLEMEEKMQQQMKTAMFVAYNREPKKVIGAFLALSDVIFVTEESASMVSEAVASGKSVVTIRPEIYHVETDYEKILEKFQRMGLSVPVNIGELSGREVNRYLFGYNGATIKSLLQSKLKKFFEERSI